MLPSRVAERKGDIIPPPPPRFCHAVQQQTPQYCFAFSKKTFQNPSPQSVSAELMFGGSRLGTSFFPFKEDL